METEKHNPFIVYVSDTRPEGRPTHVGHFRDLRSAQAEFIRLAGRDWESHQCVMLAKLTPTGVYKNIAHAR